MRASTMRALLACALAAAAIAAAATASAQATTTGILISPTLVDQTGTLRFTSAGGMVPFDVTCTVSTSKYWEYRLVAVRPTLTWMGYVTSASVTCPRPVSAVTVLGLPTTLGAAGGTKDIAYANANLLTGVLTTLVLDWRQSLTISGVECLFAGTLAIQSGAASTELTVTGNPAGTTGGLCAGRMAVSGTLTDSVVLSFRRLTV